MVLPVVDPLTVDGIAAQLRAYLEQTGESQNTLAKRLGVRPPTVSRWLSGERIPERDQLDGLADILGVDLAELRMAWFEERNAYNRGQRLTLEQLEERLRAIEEQLRERDGNSGSPSPRAGRRRRPAAPPGR